MSFRPTRLSALAAIAAAPLPTALAQSDSLEEIVVTADFRESRIEKLPISVTVLDREQLRTTLGGVKDLIRALKNERRNQKSLKLALDSLKQLQAAA